MLSVFLSRNNNENNFSNRIRKSLPSIFLKENDDTKIKQNARILQASLSTFGSRILQILNGESHNHSKIASFEPDYWLLDGSVCLPNIFPRSDMQIGFTSASISNNIGEFESNSMPFILIEINQDFFIDSFGIVFDIAGFDSCEIVQIQAFNINNNIIFDRFIRDNLELAASIKIGMNNIRRIRIIFHKTTNPNRRVRISQIYFTKIKHINPKNIKEINMIKEADKESERIPSNLLRAEILNYKDIFNFLNKKPLAEYWHGIGIHQNAEYLDWNISHKEFKIENISKQNRFININAYGLFYNFDSIFYNSNFRATNLNNLVNQILEEEEISFKAPSFFNDNILYTAFFGNIEKRRALSNIARLSGTILKENSQKEIEFIDPIANSEIVQKIERNDIIEHTRENKRHEYNGILITENIAVRRINQIIFESEFIILGSMDVSIDLPNIIFENASFSITNGFRIENQMLSSTKFKGTIIGNGICNLIIRGNQFLIRSSNNVFYPAPWYNANDIENGYKINSPIIIASMANYRSSVLPWILNRHFSILTRSEIEAKWRQNPKLILGDKISIDGNLGIITNQEINFAEGALNGRTKIGRFE